MLMKAIVFTQYGPPDGLELKEVQKPTPKDDELLISVHASSINSVGLGVPERYTVYKPPHVRTPKAKAREADTRS